MGIGCWGGTIPDLKLSLQLVRHACLEPGHLDPLWHAAVTAEGEGGRARRGGRAAAPALPPPHSQDSSRAMSRPCRMRLPDAIGKDAITGCDWQGCNYWMRLARMQLPDVIGKDAITGCDW